MILGFLFLVTSVMCASISGWAACLNFLMEDQVIYNRLISNYYKNTNLNRIPPIKLVIIFSISSIVSLIFGFLISTV